MLAILSLLSPALAFDWDGSEDLVWHNQASGVNAVWFMPRLAPGAISPTRVGYLPSAAGTNWQIAATADFNRDGFQDLLWRDPSTGRNALWFLRGLNWLNEEGSAVEIQRGETEYAVVGAEDFSGDGYPDILWKHLEQPKAAVWFMSVTQLNSVAWLTNGFAGGWRPMAVSDFDHDGKADVVWQQSEDKRMKLTLMDGTRIRSEQALPTPDDPTMRLAATGRFGYTGDTDLLWQQPDGTVSVWRMEAFERKAIVTLPKPENADWKLAGTGGFRTYRFLSADVVGEKKDDLALNWRFGLVERPDVTGPGDESVLATNYLPRSITNAVELGRKLRFRVGRDEIQAAVRLPAVFDRGTALLVVDETLSGAIAQELSTFADNLVGDGWRVVRRDVPRHDDAHPANNLQPIKDIKDWIRLMFSDRSSHHLTVILIGHVPIPYSGFMAPDGHFVNGTSGCHLGAWPADAYYADLDGLWTDETNFVYEPNCTPRPPQVNVAGDGKWDQRTIPRNDRGISQVELAVGRIDLAYLGHFRRTEATLLRRYFDKNDRFRKKRLQFDNRVVVASYFNHESLDRHQYEKAILLGSRLFGNEPHVIADGDLFTSGGSFLFGLQGGYAYYDAINTWAQVNARTGTGLHSTMDLAGSAPAPAVGIFMLAGSYFGDWNSGNNILRAVLAMPDSGLAAVWSHRFKWPFEEVALGATLGDCWMAMYNWSEHPLNVAAALLGDPTLRPLVIDPPTFASAQRDDDGLKLTWTGSREADVTYYVSRADPTSGRFELLTPCGLKKTEFPIEDNRHGTYRIRAARLVETGSGSVTNLSQGILVDVSN